MLFLPFVSSIGNEEGQNPTDDTPKGGEDEDGDPRGSHLSIFESFFTSKKYQNRKFKFFFDRLRTLKRNWFIDIVKSDWM